MKNFLFLIAILASYPVFAACPINGSADACIAQFNTVPLAPPMKITLPRNETVKEFSSTPSTTVIDRDSRAERPRRTFGPTSEDYGYNSSCQFGVCRNTGTPKGFSTEENQ